MSEVVKYARMVLNGIEKRPAMYGDTLAVELQYLLALEFLALASFGGSEPGHTGGGAVKIVRAAYFQALQKKFGTSVLPASEHKIPAEEVIELMKSVRIAVDPSTWNEVEIDISEM